VAILVDTNALYALVDDAEPQHQAVYQFVDRTEQALLVPITVLPELDYLVFTRLGPRIQIRVLRSLLGGEFQIETPTAQDLERAVELAEQYAGSGLGLVDASIAAIAERLNIRQILTLDRRDFGMLRPRHCSAFELVP
jgi:hypothetical protein